MVAFSAFTDLAFVSQHFRLKSFLNDGAPLANSRPKSGILFFAMNDDSRRVPSPQGFSPGSSGLVFPSRPNQFSVERSQKLPKLRKHPSEKKKWERASIAPRTSWW